MTYFNESEAEIIDAIIEFWLAWDEARASPTSLWVSESDHPRMVKAKERLELVSKGCSPGTYDAVIKEAEAIYERKIRLPKPFLSVEVEHGAA